MINGCFYSVGSYPRNYGLRNMPGSLQQQQRRCSQPPPLTHSSALLPAILCSTIRSGNAALAQQHQRCVFGMPNSKNILDIARLRGVKKGIDRLRSDLGRTSHKRTTRKCHHLDRLIYEEQCRPRLRTTHSLNPER